MGAQRRHGFVGRCHARGWSLRSRQYVCGPWRARRVRRPCLPRVQGTPAVCDQRRDSHGSAAAPRCMKSIVERSVSRSLRRFAIVIWIGILTAIAGRVLFGKGSNSVYSIFSTAGAAWLAGESLYRPPTLELDQFRYSPPIAAAFAVWSLLPAKVGEVAWRLLNAAVFLGTLAYWSRWWQPHCDRGAMLLLVIPLAVGGLNNGQCNALIAGLLLCSQVWFARGHWWAAGGAIAVCVLLKDYPIALGLLFAIVEPRRFTPRLVLCLAAGFLLPYILRSPEHVTEQYRAWIARVAGDDRTTLDLALAYRDLHMLLRVAGIPLSLFQYRVLESLL